MRRPRRPRARRDPADGVGEPGRRRHARLPLVDVRVDRGGEVVAVARDADQRGEADVGDLPAERLRVERRGGRGVGGVQVAEVPGAGRVDDLRAEAALRPATAAGRAPAGRRAAPTCRPRPPPSGPVVDRAAGRGDPASAASRSSTATYVCHDGSAVRRRPGRRAADARGVPPVDLGDDVPERQPGRRGVLERPARGRRRRTPSPPRRRAARCRPTTVTPCGIGPLLLRHAARLRTPTHTGRSSSSSVQEKSAKSRCPTAVNPYAS